MGGSRFNSNKTDKGHDQSYLGQPSDIVGYDDFDFPVSALTRQGQNTKPDKSDDEDEWLFDDDSTETVVGSKITKHKFQIVLKEGQTQLLWYPHIHWGQEGVGEPAWQLQYKLWKAGSLEPAWVTISGSTSEFTYTTPTLHQISVLPPIDVTNLLNTAVETKIKVSRLGASDAYVGDVRFMGFDFHVPVDQPKGSLTEFEKI